MQRLTLAVIVAALLGGLVPLGAALAQQPAPTRIPLSAPPRPVSRFPTRFDMVDAAEQFDQVLLIIDFPPGTWTPPHTHGGYVYITVIEGEISTRIVDMPGQEVTYPAGGTFFETPGEYMEVGNAATADARVIATAVLPKGAPLTINQQGVTSQNVPPGPTTVHRSSIEVDRPAGAFELVHLVLDFNPGVSTPRHLHGGQELAMPIVGALTIQRNGGAEVFTSGEAWVTTSGLVHAAGNDGADFAQVVATFLLPAGRPLTSVV